MSNTDIEDSQLSWRKVIRISAVIELLIAILWLFDALTQSTKTFSTIAEPLFAILAPLGVLFGSSYASEKPILKVPHIEKSNREIMLDKVDSYWIKGVLEQIEHSDRSPLHPLATLEPDKVLHRYFDKNDIPVHSTADVIEIFDTLNGKLLITGSPGSGKTVSMLQLARHLIKEARTDEQQPIPVILNLSTWSLKHKNFENWLKEQLFVHYQVSKKVLNQWLDKEDLLLLLDGFDEVAFNATGRVAKQYRENCIDSINVFSSLHKKIKICICSRLEELEMLKSKFDLRGAIQLQPLTKLQIQDHLKGDDLVGLREISRSNTSIQSLQAVPFLLNAMSMAYKEKTILQLRLSEGKENEDERRKDILSKYVENRLNLYKTNQLNISHAKIRHFLRWLAFHLTKHEDIIFYIEFLNANWLSKRQKHYFDLLVFSLGFLLLLLYLQLNFVVYSSGDASGNAFKSILLLSLSLIYFLGIKKLFDKNIDVIEYMQWNWKDSLAASTKSIGMVIKMGMIYGACCGILFFVIAGVVTSGFYGGIVGFLVGLFVGSIAGTILFLGVFGPLIAMFGGISTGTLDLRYKPNQGMRNTTKLALSTSIVSGLFVFLLTVIFQISTSFGITSGLFTAIGMGLFFGGGTIIKHLFIRSILRCSDTPYNLATTLDYCNKIHLLRKIGGGYIFPHRYIMEYFTEEYTQQHPEIAKDQ